MSVFTQILSYSSRIDATVPLIRCRRASNKRRMNELQRVAASNWGLQASALFYNKLWYNNDPWTLYSLYTTCHKCYTTYVAQRALEIMNDMKSLLFLCLVDCFATWLFYFILYSLGVVNYNKEWVCCCLPYFRVCNKSGSNVVELIIYRAFLQLVYIVETFRYINFHVNIGRNHCFIWILIGAWKFKYFIFSLLQVLLQWSYSTVAIQPQLKRD